MRLHYGERILHMLRLGVKAAEDDWTEISLCVFPAPA